MTDQTAVADWRTPLLAEPSAQLTLQERITAGARAGWANMYDSIDPAAVATFDPPPQLIAGYPVRVGQGLILANGEIDGWEPEDFLEFESQGIGVKRIANLSPAWRACSIADGEAGALTWADCATFVMGRESYKPGTSTVYASLDNWAAVGRACRARQPSWAFVAFWPQYPSAAEVDYIRGLLAQVCPGTRLGVIQYRNLIADDIDLSAVVDPAWARS